MRITTMGILAPNLERVNHLRSYSRKMANVFCGRHDTLAVSGEITRQRALLTMLSVLSPGSAAYRSVRHWVHPTQASNLPRHARLAIH